MVEMISHGQITNAAFYNYTTLSDLKVISAMLKDVANSWNFKTTLIRINKTVTIDKLPFDFDVILNNASDQQVRKSPNGQSDNTSACDKRKKAY